MSVAELVDAPDLKSVEHYARGGSSPPTRTRGSTIDLQVEAAPPLNIPRIGYTNEVSSRYQVLLV